MKKIFITLASVLLAGALNAQNLPVALIDLDPQTIALGKTGETISERMFSENDFNIDLGGTFWAPKAANNMAIEADASYRINNKMAFQLEYKMFQERIPSMGMTDTGTPTGEFKSSESAIGLGFSYKVLDGLSVGLNARYFAMSAASKASAFGVDINAAYSLEKINLGLAVCNLGSSYSFGTTKTSLPMFAKVTATYELIDALNIHGEIDYVIKGGLMAGIGAEYTIIDMISVRAGYHYGDKAIPSYASAGLGFKIAGININAAYLLGSKTLANTIAVGIGYSF